MNNIELPSLNQSRLIGMEIEVDNGSRNGSDAVNEVNLPEGWERVSDGSVHNGYEFRTNPPRPYADTKERIIALCSELGSEITIHKAGGVHVHVQVHDYELENLKALMRLYTIFQVAIDKLLPASRRNNSYCKKFNLQDLRDENFDTIVNLFDLNSSMSTRERQHGQARYYVINPIFFRCTNRLERSVEFRQGSTSKRAVNNAGWAAFVTTLVYICSVPSFVEIVNNLFTTSLDQEEPSSFDDLVAFIREVESELNVRGMSDWLQWRYEYMNAAPSNEDVEKLVAALSEKPHGMGMYALSRVLATNLTRIKAIAHEAVRRRLAIPHGDNKWRLSFAAIAETDLAALEAAHFEVRDKLIFKRDAVTSNQYDVAIGSDPTFLSLSSLIHDNLPEADRLSLSDRQLSVIDMINGDFTEEHEAFATSFFEVVNALVGWQMLSLGSVENGRFRVTVTTSFDGPGPSSPAYEPEQEDAAVLAE